MRSKFTSRMRRATICVIVAVLPVTLVKSQAPEDRPPTPQWQIDAGGKMAFDAVSVKLSKSTEGGRGNLGQSGGHVSMTVAPLLSIVAQAYKFTT